MYNWFLRLCRLRVASSALGAAPWPVKAPHVPFRGWFGGASFRIYLRELEPVIYYNSCSSEWATKYIYLKDSTS